MYDAMSAIVCTANGERKLTVAKDFFSIDKDSKRGVLEMFDEDAWPAIDERNPTHFLPKDRDNYVQHIRDALLMGTNEIMNPPGWNFKKDPTR